MMMTCMRARAITDGEKGKKKSVPCVERMEGAGGDNAPTNSNKTTQTRQKGKPKAETSTKLTIKIPARVPQQTGLSSNMAQEENVNDSLNADNVRPRVDVSKKGNCTKPTDQGPSNVEPTTQSAGLPQLLNKTHSGIDIPSVIRGKNILDLFFLRISLRNQKNSRTSL